MRAGRHAGDDHLFALSRLSPAETCTGVGSTPDGLTASEIPLLPRILQVVDVYDALRTARPYKPALSHDHAAQTMRDESNRGLWDKDLVMEYFSMLEQKRQVA